jgi:hypothetical protein
MPFMVADAAVSLLSGMNTSARFRPRAPMMRGNAFDGRNVWNIGEIRANGFYYKHRPPHTYKTDN